MTFPIFQLSGWLDCRWQKETCHGYRYYHVLLHQDLLGQWNLTRIWGGSLRQAGRVRQHILESRDQGLRVLKEISKRRKVRGYRIVQKLDNENRSLNQKS
ncbi:MAG: hypothetical protein ACRERU_06040 [Methylococcales bacterium]